MIDIIWICVKINIYLFITAINLGNAYVIRSRIHVTKVIWFCCKPLSQWQHSFQMKAVLLLAERLATISYNISNTDFCCTLYWSGNQPVDINTSCNFAVLVGLVKPLVSNIFIRDIHFAKLLKHPFYHVFHHIWQMSLVPSSVVTYQIWSCWLTGQ